MTDSSVDWMWYGKEPGKTDQFKLLKLKYSKEKWGKKHRIMTKLG